jgi:hypothetical protein
MKQITRNIDPVLAQDLLKQVPRACIAFASDQGAYAQPVLLSWHDEQYKIAVQELALYQPTAGQEVVLLVDEGIYYFDLRAIYVRGSVQPLQTPSDTPAGYIWFELTPAKTIAWDYGTMREVDDDHE